MRSRRTRPPTRPHLLVLLLALGLPPAQADEPPAPSPAEREERAKALRESLALDLEIKRLVDAQRFVEALPKARESVERSERLHGVNDTLTGVRVSKLGAILFELGRLAEARPLLERGLAVQTRAFGPRSPITAQARSNYAALLSTLGRFAEAREQLELALAENEAFFGKEHVTASAIMTNLGSVADELGHLREALDWQQRALAVVEKSQFSSAAARVASMINVAWAHQALGDLQAALVVLERAYALALERFGPDAPLTGAVLGNLGVLHADMGDFARSEQLARQALAIAEAAEGRAPGSARLELMNLGVTLAEAGHHAAAREALERAVAAHEAALGPSHPQTALALGNLASLLGNLGERAAQLVLCRRALEITQAALGLAHPATARDQQALGLALEAVGRSQEAWPLLQQALRTVEEALGAEHATVARHASNLAAVARSLERPAEARALYERALRLLERAQGADHPDLGAVHGMLAILMHEQADIPGAERHFVRALEITERAFGGDHPQMIARLHNLAMHCVISEDGARATRYFGRALELAERRLRRELPTAVGPQRLALARQARRWVGTYEHAVGKLGADGYEAALRFKGLVGRLERAEQLARRSASTELAAAVEALRGSERLLAAHSLKPPRADQVEKRAAWQRRYAELSARQQEQARVLTRALEEAGAAAELAVVSPSDVRTALEAGSILVDLLRTDRLYVAWVGRAGGEVARVELGSAEALDAAAREFAERAAAAESGTDAALGAAGRRLGALLLAPLAAWLTAEVRTLIIAPDGALAAIPFAALPGRAPGTHLIDDHVLVLVAMAQDVLAGASGREAGSGGLLVGGVDYAAPSSAPEPAPTPTDPAAAAPPAAPPEDRGRRWRFLPGSEAEVDALGARLGEASQVLKGRAATEAALRERSPGRRLLHLASHGFVDAEAQQALASTPGEKRWLGGLEEVQLTGMDPRLLSGLALAGANARKSAGEDDGILTSLEAAQLDLRACERVVLSACETALGRVEAGEGVIGLVQAFQTAGARDVVASLWKVDDRATALLMQRFYDGVLREEDPLPTSQALREAALWLREAKPEGRDYSAPRYWAAFVAYERR